MNATCGMRNAESVSGRTPRVARARESAFTMVEIAISLAVIGFALVAIIGILPSAMQVQKDNREETIINQDASIFMGAIRDGAQGLDDLTNYVVAITNFQTEYNPRGSIASTFVSGYTSTYPPDFPLTNGFRIVGLLSTPKYFPNPASGGFYSNYVVAHVRSLSGPASEKAPQTNSSLQDLAFSYRLISEVVPYAIYNPNWTNYTDPNIIGNANEITLRSNYWLMAKNIQTNLHDVRLTFRWPLFANHTSGNGRQSYRTLVSGHLMPTNQGNYRLYFFEPRTYVKAP